MSRTEQTAFQFYISTIIALMHIVNPKFHLISILHKYDYSTSTLGRDSTFHRISILHKYDYSASMSSNS